MESLFFKVIFEKLVDGIIILIVTGGILAGALDLQKSAFRSKSVGLISILKLNRQLIGKTM